jgi:hypothetical protein
MNKILIKHHLFNNYNPHLIKLFFVEDSRSNREYFLILVETSYPDETIETEDEFNTFEEANKFYKEYIA